MINNFLVRTFVRILREDVRIVKSSICHLWKSCCSCLKLDSLAPRRVGFVASDPLRPQFLEANLFW